MKPCVINLEVLVRGGMSRGGLPGGVSVEGGVCHVACRGVGGLAGGSVEGGSAGGVCHMAYRGGGLPGGVRRFNVEGALPFRCSGGLPLYK